MACDENHQQQDNNRNQRKCRIISDLTGTVGSSSVPIPSFDPVFHSHRAQMLQVVCKFAGTVIAMLRIALESAVEHLLQLR